MNNTITLEKYFANELALADRIELENQVGDDATLKIEFDFFKSAQTAMFRQQKENYLATIRDVETQLYEEGFFINEEEVERYLDGSLPRYKQTAFKNKLKTDTTFREIVEQAEAKENLKKELVQQNTRKKIESITNPQPTGKVIIRSMIVKSMSIAAGFVLLIGALLYFNSNKQLTVSTPGLAEIQKEIPEKVEAIRLGWEHENNHQQGFKDSGSVIKQAILLIKNQEIENAFTLLDNMDKPKNMSKYLAAWCAIQSGNHLETAVQNLEELSKKEVYPPLSIEEIKYQLAKAYLLSNTNIGEANTILEDLLEKANNPYPDFNTKVQTLLKTIEK